MVKLKKSDDAKYWVNIEQLGASSVTGESVIGTTTWENWQYLQKLNIYLLCDPQITLSGEYLTEMQADSPQICRRIFIAALFIIALDWRQLKCLSTIKQISKLGHTYTNKYNEKE